MCVVAANFTEHRRSRGTLGYHWWNPGWKHCSMALRPRYRLAFHACHGLVSLLANPEFKQTHRSLGTTVFRGKFFWILPASLPTSTAHRVKFTLIFYGFWTQPNMQYLSPVTATDRYSLSTK